MSRYWQPQPGDPISSSLFTQAFGELESLTNYVIGKGILSGLTVSGTNSLTLTVSAGSAIFAGGEFDFAGATLNLVSNSINYIYLVSVYDSSSRTYSAQIISNTTAIDPANSICLGTATTNSTVVISTNFNSSGNRAPLIQTLSYLSGQLNIFTNGGYFPVSATGQLINYINTQSVSGNYLTNYTWGIISGSFVKNTDLNNLIGPLTSASGSYALNSDLNSLATNTDLRIKQITSATGNYLSQNQINTLNSKFNNYLPISASISFASADSVRALLSLTGSFASSTGSFTPSSGSSTNGVLSLQNITGSVVIIPSGSLKIASSGNALILYSPVSTTTSLNNLTGSITLLPSGGVSISPSENALVISGYDANLYNQLSGSLVSSRYGLTFPNIGNRLGSIENDITYLTNAVSSGNINTGSTGTTTTSTTIVGTVLGFNYDIGTSSTIIPFSNGQAAAPYWETVANTVITFTLTRTRTVKFDYDLIVSKVSIFDAASAPANACCALYTGCPTGNISGFAPPTGSILNPTVSRGYWTTGNNCFIKDSIIVPLSAGTYSIGICVVPQGSFADYTLFKRSITAILVA